MASVLAAGFLPASLVSAAPAASSPAPAAPEADVVAPNAPVPRMYIQEYRVAGAKTLPQIEVETAVYPFLGPGRTADDVEQARAALEKAYHDKGYQTVQVVLPAQQARGGVVVLQVMENKVGRLRVKGSRYFDLNDIKKRAPSLAEGTLPNFNQITRDIVALNQLPDRRITPELRAGVEPGTVDIDLNVKDTFPLHGSVELNNRYSANTKPLRLNLAASYNNLWQAGHTIGFNYQVAPERPSDSQVFSGYYIARFPSVDWLSLMVTATKQDSDVSSLGSVAVAGRGEVIGGRAIITLPPGDGFFHSLSFGMDYKNFDQNVTVGLDQTTAPVQYYPVTLGYTATWAGKGYTTELNAGVTMHFRGMGSDQLEFENSRFKADGNFLYVRGDLSHTHDLPGGMEVEAKVQGQASSAPLVSSEQFGGGGLGTVRGYLEAEALGDNGLFGSIELRSPSLLGWMKKEGNEWRFYAFAEGGFLTVNEPLPEQERRFNLASVGLGSRIQLFNHLNGSLDAAIPLIDQTETTAGDVRLTFRVWADF